MITGDPPLRIRYNLNGNLPAGDSVYFSLDGGKPFSSFDDGGLFNVGPARIR